MAKRFTLAKHTLHVNTESGEIKFDVFTQGLKITYDGTQYIVSLYEGPTMYFMNKVIEEA